MSIDPKAAETLRALFAARAGNQECYLLPQARIVLHNMREERMEFVAKTPLSAAQMLRHIMVNDGNGAFNRKGPEGTASLWFGMDKRVRLAPDNKEHFLSAFCIEYKDLDRSGRMFIEHPEVRTYRWMGDTKVMDKDPMECTAPRLQDLIMVLERAGEEWGNVNFMRVKNTPAIHLAVDNKTPVQGL